MGLFMIYLVSGHIYIHKLDQIRIYFVIFGCSIMVSCNSESFIEKYTLQNILFHLFCFTPVFGWERICTVFMIMSLLPSRHNPSNPLFKSLEILKIHDVFKLHVASFVYENLFQRTLLIGLGLIM